MKRAIVLLFCISGLLSVTTAAENTTDAATFAESCAQLLAGIPTRGELLSAYATAAANVQTACGVLSELEALMLTPPTSSLARWLTPPVSSLGRWWGMVNDFLCLSTEVDDKGLLDSSITPKAEEHLAAAKCVFDYVMKHVAAGHFFLGRRHSPPNNT